MSKPTIYHERIMLRLATDQLKRVEKYAKRNKLTVSESIRRLVDAGLEERMAPAKRDARR